MSITYNPPQCGHNSFQIASSYNYDIPARSVGVCLFHNFGLSGLHIGVEIDNSNSIYRTRGKCSITVRNNVLYISCDDIIKKIYGLSCCKKTYQLYQNLEDNTPTFTIQYNTGSDTTKTLEKVEYYYITYQNFSTNTRTYSFDFKISKILGVNPDNYIYEDIDEDITLDNPDNKYSLYKRQGIYYVYGPRQSLLANDSILSCINGYYLIDGQPFIKDMSEATRKYNLNKQSRNISKNTTPKKATVGTRFGVQNKPLLLTNGSNTYSDLDKDFIDGYIFDTEDAPKILYQDIKVKETGTVDNQSIILYEDFSHEDLNCTLTEGYIDQRCYFIDTGILNIMDRYYYYIPQNYEVFLFRRYGSVTFKNGSGQITRGFYPTERTNIPWDTGGGAERGHYSDFIAVESNNLASGAGPTGIALNLRLYSNTIPMLTNAPYNGGQGYLPYNFRNIYNGTDKDNFYIAFDLRSYISGRQCDGAAFGDIDTLYNNFSEGFTVKNYTTTNTDINIGTVRLAQNLDMGNIIQYVTYGWNSDGSTTNLNNRVSLRYEVPQALDPGVPLRSDLYLNFSIRVQTSRYALFTYNNIESANQELFSTYSNNVTYGLNNGMNSITIDTPETSNEKHEYKLLNNSSAIMFYLNKHISILPGTVKKDAFFSSMGTRGVYQDGTIGRDKIIYRGQGGQKPHTSGEGACYVAQDPVQHSDASYGEQYYDSPHPTFASVDDYLASHVTSGNYSYPIIAQAGKYKFTLGTTFIGSHNNEVFAIMARKKREQ